MSRGGTEKDVARKEEQNAGRLHTGEIRRCYLGEGGRSQPVQLKRWMTVPTGTSWDTDEHEKELSFSRIFLEFSSPPPLFPELQVSQVWTMWWSPLRHRSPVRPCHPKTFTAEAPRRGSIHLGSQTPQNELQLYVKIRVYAYLWLLGEGIPGFH